MKNKAAIRDAYGNALKDLGQINHKVTVLDADVGSSTKSILFGKQFPDRYFNVGISELNMIDMAAGLALEGFIPFVNTFSIFMTTRSLDPIQSLIAYDELNVKLCGTYCGLSDSYDGASHQAITDISIMRSIPNMTVICPSDPEQTRQFVYSLADFSGPVYFRLSRAEVPVIYSKDSMFEIGKGIVLEDGEDLTIISTGSVIRYALEASSLLESCGIHATVIDMPTIKPIDKELIISYAQKTGAVLTVEEHSIFGGLGSAVSEVLSQESPTLLSMIGLTSFAESGNLDLLMKKYGFSAENIAQSAKNILSKKEKYHYERIHS